MVSRFMSEIAKRVFLKQLSGLRHGSLEVVCPESTYHFGDQESSLRAVLAVHNERFFARAVWGGDIGFGESFVDGDWSTPDLVAVVRLAVRNLEGLEQRQRAYSVLSRMANWLRHRGNRNTLEGSRRNIAYHYDLGNDFYRLFLDHTLAYSSAYYSSEADSLESAQMAKYEHICRKLQLGPQDHLLEIGTGWGGFAAYAAEHFGCRITTTTISQQQHDHARQVFDRVPGGDRITLLLEDYRNLRGQFDKIVSIEMFEAVGFGFYDQYFTACDRLLKPDGIMLLQTITIQERQFAHYLRQSDWIRKYIFPGAELASVVEIGRSLARATQLQIFHLEDIGIHYALTLEQWRLRFLQAAGEVRSLGFDANFLRMWEYYLAYCEAGFRERYISNVQILLSKLGNRLRLAGEPAYSKNSTESPSGLLWESGVNSSDVAVGCSRVSGS